MISQQSKHGGVGVKNLQSIVIDLDAIQRQGDIHPFLRDTFGFPSWYGYNFDAFWDAITGLVEMPNQIRFERWEEFSIKFPSEAASIKESFRRAKELYPETSSNVCYS